VAPPRSIPAPRQTRRFPIKGYLRKSALGAAAVASVLIVVATPALPAFSSPGNTTGTATLTAGTLSFTPPTTVDFAGTLTGAAQSLPASQAIDVFDDTGSGAGWNITLTSTTFTSGGNTLSTTGTTDTGATGACDATITCTLGNNAATTYPLVVPAGTTAPTAVKIQTAAAASGLANQTWTHSMALAVPAVARAGVYSSTWTYSLVSGP
jgi:hypothetical protein